MCVQSPSFIRSTISQRPTISSTTSGRSWLIRCAQRCGQASHSGFWFSVCPTYRYGPPRAMPQPIVV